MALGGAPDIKTALSAGSRTRGSAPASSSPGGFDWGAMASRLGSNQQAQVQAKALSDKKRKQEEGYRKSFLEAPAKQRAYTIDRLTERAKKGDENALAQLKILEPVAGKPGQEVQKAPAYKNKVLNFIASTGEDVLSKASRAIFAPVESVNPEQYAAAPTLTRQVLTQQAREANKPSTTRGQIANTAETSLNLFTGGKAKTILSTGQKVIQGAKIGGKFGGAQAGIETFRDENATLGDYLKNVAVGTGVGTVAGAGFGAAGAGAGKVGSRVANRGLSSADNKARVLIREALLDSGEHDLARQFNVVKSVDDLTKLSDQPRVQEIINKPLSPEVKALATGNVPKSGGLIVPEVSRKGSVAQSSVYDTAPREPKVPGQPTSRVQQFDDALQETVAKVEASPDYKTQVFGREGGRVVPVTETVAEARKLGPLDEFYMKNARAGEKVDAVTVVRSHATVDASAREFNEAVKANAPIEQLQAMHQNLAELQAGHQLLTAEPARATQIQGQLSDRALRVAELGKQLEGNPGPAAVNRLKREMDRELKRLAKEAEQDKSGIGRTIYQGAIEYATAAKLSSPLTHAKNLVGNTLTFLQRGLEQTGAVAIGTAKGQTGLGELKYVFGRAAAWKSASSKFASAFKDIVQLTGEEGFSKAREMRPTIIPGKVGKFIRTPFRFLEAADDFGKTILRDTEIHQRAYEQAFQEGLKGRQLTNRIAEIAQNPSPQILERAEKVAKEFTFQSDSGAAVKAITKFIDKVPGGRFFVPFIQTPTNIVKFQLQRTPLGIMFPEIRTALRAGGVEGREAASKMITGTMLSVGSYAYVSDLYDKGMITGQAPENQGERDLFYSSGRKPYSIKIGDKWVSYQAVQPLGLYLLQGIGLKKALSEGDKKDALGIATAMIGTAFKGLADLPFVSGVNNFIEAVNKPEQNINKFFAQGLTGLIPNLSRDFANYQDDIQRYPKTIQDQIKLMIPGLSKEVAPRIDITGKPQKKAADPFVRGFVKVVSEDKKNTLLETLLDLGKRTNYFPSTASETVRGEKLSRTDYVRYQELAGKYFSSELAKAIASSQFQNENDDQKESDVRGMVDRSRAKARDELFGKAPKKSKVKRNKY